ncbi:hypothetical protein RFZ03_22020, partial [Acinetobacter baumannii]|nr:hypothetical protein [Acinetobacter baumannii]
RLEEQIKTGSFVAGPAAQRTSQGVSVQDEEEERTPLPDDADAPPIQDEELPQAADDAPIGFWSELCGSVRKELKPPIT